jgi:hypothetical protein
MFPRDENPSIGREPVNLRGVLPGSDQLSPDVSEGGIQLPRLRVGATIREIWFELSYNLVFHS